MLVVGGVLAALCALVAGTSGFGFSLMATPLLLLCGFSLRFVVTANLLISLATRATVAWRLRRAIHPRRVGMLLAGAVPGLWLGSRTLGALDGRAVNLAAGSVVTAAAVAVAVAERRPSRPRVRGLNVAAGFLGGLLATTTSLTGVPPALLLARRRLAQESYFADLALFFVATAAIGIGILTADGHVSGGGAAAAGWWLPGVVVANAAGVTLGLRLPARAFRGIAFALAFAAGVATIATA